MNRGNRGRIGWLLALGCWGSNGTEAAEPAPDTTPWCYQLIAGARLLDDCSVCDRLPLEIPLRGGFEVRLAERNPLFDRYELGAVRFTDGAEPPGYELTGRGTFTWGGEVALVQEWSLEGTPSCCEVRWPRSSASGPCLPPSWSRKMARPSRVCS
jgi:hypothetical protein